MRSLQPDFIVTTGDNNYGTRPPRGATPDTRGAAEYIDFNIGQFYHPFISPYTGTYGAPAPNGNRFFPTLGNADWYQPYPTHTANLNAHFAGKPLGRPKQQTDANREQLKQAKEQRRQEYLQRIPIEGKFGQGKNGYRLNYIRAKRADTSFAWINSIFLVMNLLILVRIFFALKKGGFGHWLMTITTAWSMRVLNLRNCFARHGQLIDYAR